MIEAWSPPVTEIFIYLQVLLTFKCKLFAKIKVYILAQVFPSIYTATHQKPAHKYLSKLMDTLLPENLYT